MALNDDGSVSASWEYAIRAQERRTKALLTHKCRDCGAYFTYFSKDRHYKHCEACAEAEGSYQWSQYL